MLRLIASIVGVAFLVFITAMMLSISIPGEGSFRSFYSGWAEVCSAKSDLTPCAQRVLQLINESLRAALERLRFLWHSYTVAMMGGGITLVILMLILRQRPFFRRLIGAFVFLVLVAGIYVLAERDWQTTASIIAQMGRLIFITLAVIALVSGSMMLFGGTLRWKKAPDVEGVFVIRTSHSTPFPQRRPKYGEKIVPATQDQTMVGDIDGATGSVRVSITCSHKLESDGVSEGDLVRISWKDRPNGRFGSRSLYRRVRTYSGISAPFSPAYHTSPRYELQKNEFPLLIMHFEDKAKLFGDGGLWLSDSDRSKITDVENDKRDFAELRIGKADYWDWFHYVFNHTDPAVAWSFRMGIAVSLVLVVTQITVLEPVLSAADFVRR